MDKSLDDNAAGPYPLRKFQSCPGVVATVQQQTEGRPLESTSPEVEHKVYQRGDLGVASVYTDMATNSVRCVVEVGPEKIIRVIDIDRRSFQRADYMAIAYSGNPRAVEIWFETEALARLNKAES